MSWPVLVTAAVIAENGKVLLTKRPPGSHLEGTWEFPGGKVEADETPADCLRRELAEELGVTAEIGEPFRFTYWEYPDRRILLLFYLCRLTSGVPRPLGCSETAWFSPAELGSLAMPPADRPVIEEVRQLLNSNHPGGSLLCP